MLRWNARSPWCGRCGVHHDCRGPASADSDRDAAGGLVYHRGFLAVDTFGSASPLSPERRSTLRRTADAALRAAEQDLVHLVQARIGPDQLAYIAIARRKPRQAGASLSVRLLEAA